MLASYHDDERSASFGSSAVSLFIERLAYPMPQYMLGYTFLPEPRTRGWTFNIRLYAEIQNFQRTLMMALFL